MGFHLPANRRGALAPLMMAIPFILLALILLQFCKELTLADMLVLRYVSDQTCTAGGMESNDLALPYVCIIASAVAAIRAVSKRRNYLHDSKSDI